MPSGTEVRNVYSYIFNKLAEAIRLVTSIWWAFAFNVGWGTDHPE
jgi:hypothetical protein